MKYVLDTTVVSSRKSDPTQRMEVPEHAPFDDALIAAIAQAGDVTVATRSAKYFEPRGVRCPTHGTYAHRTRAR